MNDAIVRKLLVPLVALCILGVGGELVSSVVGAESASVARVLEPEEAFQAQVRGIAADRIAIDFTVAPGHYLYRERLRFAVQSPADTGVKEVLLPQSKQKDDPSFGLVEVYPKSFQAIVTLHPTTAATPVKFEVAYQGCSEQGLCYLPVAEGYEVNLTTGAIAQPVAAALVTPTGAAPIGTASTGTAPSVGAESDTAAIAGMFANKSFLLVIASFFGFGLLLALTPCVFPMIPILSGIIVGQGANLTRSRALGLSVAYVLGMALTYAAAGVAAGLSGTLLTAALQNGWVLSVFALVFVGLSLSMFGFYELQLPSSVQSKFNDMSNGLNGGKLASVFAMGALSALIVGPCVAAPLAGALLYIGQSGDVVLGGMALFAMAIGMGVPLLIIGTSAGALLPRAGKWMEGVKRLFGVLLLAVAIWIVSPVVPPIVPMVLWGVLLVIYAMYLHAIDPLPHDARGGSRFAKGIGVVMLLAGCALLLGALSGNADPLQPLASVNVRGKADEASPAIKFERVLTPIQFEQRLKAAAGKPVMVDFYADWCVSCKEMERFTFADARVQTRLRELVLLKVDVTDNSSDSKALLKRFGLFGPPGIAFFDRQGNELKASQVVGYRPPEQFLATVQDVIARN